MSVDMTLAKAGEKIDTICFLEGGLVGFAEVLSDGRRLAVAVTGREGFVGWPLLLGNDRWPHEVIVRAEHCSALRLSAAYLREAMDRNLRIRDLLVRYTGTLVAQMTRTIVSNLIHPIEVRTARWLLLYHDRIDSDVIRLTHTELSIMLGCRRSSITEAIARLEGIGAIRGFRGRLVIRDRATLERLAGDTYGFSEAQYERLILNTER